MSSGPFAPTIQVAAGAVPEGKVADFLTGRHVRDTPEEYVRQNLEKALVRQYRFRPADCEPEFAIRVGSSRKRVDVAVFIEGAKHTQENIHLIVETKRAGTSPDEPGSRRRPDAVVHGCVPERSVRNLDQWRRQVRFRQAHAAGRVLLRGDHRRPRAWPERVRSGEAASTGSEARSSRQPAVRLPPLPQLHRRYRGQAEGGGVLGAAEADLLQDRGRAIAPAGLLRHSCRA